MLTTVANSPCRFVAVARSARRRPSTCCFREATAHWRGPHCGPGRRHGRRTLARMSDPEVPPELRGEVPFDEPRDRDRGRDGSGAGGSPIWVRLVALTLIVALVLFFTIQAF